MLKGGLDELLRVKVFTPTRRKNAELLVWSTVHGLASILISHALMDPGSVDVERVTLEIVRRLYARIANGLSFPLRPPLLNEKQRHGLG